ncbi:MAG TPA: PP2C family protein-serine/threonine phosphatase [Kineosporiaceae bacterium]
MTTGAAGVGGDPAALLGPARLAWELSPAATCATQGPEHVLVFQNRASLALFGTRPRGVPILTAFPGTTVLTRADMDAVLRTGEPITQDRRLMGLRDPDGREMFMRSVIAPYGPPGRPPVGLVISGVDLSGEARAEVAANRAAVLAEVTHAMNVASDPGAALHALTDLLVPRLADVAAVYVLPDPRGAHDLAARPHAPESLSLAPHLHPLGPPPPWTTPRSQPVPWQEALAAGVPVLIPFGDRDPARTVPDPRARAWLAGAQARALAAVPLTAAGSLLGVLLLVAAGERQPYTERILPFLTDLANRAGIAIAQVRQHQAELRVSHQLQQAFLPVAPPQPAGLHVAARYLAGAPDVGVGGDWWDVVPLDGNRLAVGVGDASGHGTDAAVLMGQARAAARAATLAGLSPGDVLGLVDQHLVSAIADLGAGDDTVGDVPQFATAVHAVIDPSAGQARIANAGHVPMVALHHPSRRSRLVQIPPGPPLGLGHGGYPEVVVDLPAATSLLLFTDGLVEDRARDLDLGLEALCRQLEAHAHHDVETCLDAVLAGMGAGCAERSDDVAALLLRLDPPHLHAPP